MTMPTAYLPEQVDELLQSLAESAETWAGGAALYGPGGLFDAQRKARLSLIAAEIRDAYKGEKITESRIDEMAHAHPDYQDFITKSTTDRAKWLTLDAERAHAMLTIKVLTYNPVR